MWGERAMQNGRTVLPEVLIMPTKIIIRPVIRVTIRATVDMLLSLLFVQQNMEKNSITVLSSTAVCLSCNNYLSCTKLLEDG